MEKIIIHVGPPKSGTSAIQKWMSDNRDLLLKNGVFYPSHETDENGVSSGNLLSLFDKSSNGELQFSNIKLTQLRTKAELENCHTLVLSSEFFFLNIRVLATKIPTATFLAYIRFPLEVVESSYNQGIKRHNQTKAFGVSAQPQHHQLQELINQMKVVGTHKFRLRPYLQECFHGGSIISDFLHCVNANMSFCKKLTHISRVNNSYTLEALEFKRWFNQFDLGGMSHKLDMFLQKISFGTTTYSLVPQNLFVHHKELFVKRLNEVKQVYKIDNIETFLDNCTKIEQKPRVRQYLSDGDFEKLLKLYLHNNPRDISTIVRAVVKAQSDLEDIKNKHRITIIKKNIPRSVYLRELFRLKLNGMIGG